MLAIRQRFLAFGLVVAVLVGGTARSLGDEKDDPTYKAWVALLKHEDAKERVRASEALASIGTAAKSAVPALVEATKDPALSARRSAAVALARVSPKHVKTAVNVLLELMKDDADSWGGEKGLASLFARDDLARIGRSAVPLLVVALRDSNKTLRENVAATLGKMGPEAKESVKALTTTLGDKEVRVRVAAASSLARLSPGHSRTAIDVLVKALKDDADSAVGGRYAAIGALGELGPVAKPAIPALASLVSVQDDPLSRAAAAALKKIKAEPKGPDIWEEVLRPKKDDLVTALAKRLKEGDTESRRDAASDLGKMGPKAKDAVPTLSAALKDANPGVVKLAAFALGKIGADGVPPLILGLQDEDELLRGYCSVGLVEAGKPAVAALVKLLRSRNKTTVSTACAVLGKIGKPAVPDLAKALKDEDSQVRGFALLALGQMGTAAKEAASEIRELLEDSHPGIRKAAAGILKKLDP